MKQFLKFLLILLLSFGAAGSSYAQKQGQAKIDSMLKELPMQKEDTNKVKLLDKLSSAYIYINPDEGLKFGQQCLDLATKLDWKEEIAWAYLSLGNNYLMKSDYTNALEYYFKNLKLNEEIGNKRGIASVTGNIGIIYTQQSNYPKALEYFFKSLKLSEELGDKKGIAYVTGNIGNIYDDQEDYPKALEYFFKSLKLNDELGNKRGIGYNTANIGNIYKSQKDYPKALEYLFKALKQEEEIGDKSSIAISIGNIGSVYKARKNYIMAVEYMQRALKLCEEFGYKGGIAINLANIGSAYIAIIKDTSAKMSKVTVAAESSEYKYQPTASIPNGKAALLAGAIDYLQRALVINKEIKALEGMQGCYDNLSEAYKLKGDYKKVMEYSDSLRVIRDSVFSQGNREQITKLENGRKAYGDSLKAVAIQKALDIKAMHRRNYEFIGMGVLALALGFIFIISRNRNQLAKEKQQSENLLLNILPEEVASELKKTGAAAARQFDDVTVLFTDFVNFTEASERMKPEVLLEELNTCFKSFDGITGKYGIEKIKTIGDAYLAVGGLPKADPKHAENAVKAAKEISQFMEDRISKLGKERTFEIRIGIHSGSVVAGIVGVKKFAYDIWGDTVNTAARMEQNSEAGKINISATTFELVKDKFTCEYRGEIDAKGKGMLKMYYING